MRTESQQLDIRLLHSAACGSGPAVSALYERHCERLRAVARRLLGNAYDAEDLLHDVFIEAWQHALDYDCERGSVRSWMLMRLRSRARDRLRVGTRSRPIERAPESEVPAAQPQAADAERICRALCQLDQSRREALALFYLEGLSASEVAGRLQIPVGTVKSRLRLGLAQLRESLGTED